MKLLAITNLLLIFTSAAFGQLTNKTPLIPSAERNADIIKKTKKINKLIKVFNSYSFSSNEAYKRYTSSFGNDINKFVKHKNWYSGASITINKIKAIKELDKVYKLDVYPELNSFILTYQESALDLIALLNKTFPYYDMEDYKSDNFLKATEYHPLILNAYSQFFDADNQLRKQSEKVRRKLKSKYLAQLEKKEESFNYLIQIAMDKSERILKTVQVSEYNLINSKDLKEDHDNLRAILDRLTTLKNKEPEKFNQNYYMSWFYSALKDFIKSSKELYLRKKNNKPFTKGEQMNLTPSSGWMVNGSTYQVLSKYNDLIDWYNSMTNNG